MDLKSSNIIFNALQLSFFKKTFGLRVKYLFLAIVFTPLIFWESKGGLKNSDNDGSSQSLAGDDIYPLF